MSRELDLVPLCGPPFSETFLVPRGWLQQGLALELFGRMGRFPELLCAFQAAQRSLENTRESGLPFSLAAGVRCYDQSEPVVPLESCPCCVLSRRQLGYDENKPQH